MPHLLYFSETKVISTPPPLLKGGEGAGGGKVRSASSRNGGKGYMINDLLLSSYAME